MKYITTVGTYTIFFFAYKDCHIISHEYVSQEQTRNNQEFVLGLQHKPLINWQ